MSRSSRVQEGTAWRRKAQTAAGFFVDRHATAATAETAAFLEGIEGGLALSYRALADASGQMRRSLPAPRDRSRRSGRDDRPRPDRVPDHLLGEPQSGHRAGAGQHAADRRRLRLILRDSRARALVRVGRALTIAPPVLAQPAVRSSMSSSSGGEGAERAAVILRALLADAAPHAKAARRRRTMPASGSTRRARPARRRARVTSIRSLILTAELYARPVLGIARGRRRLLRGEAVLRLWARQCADLPDGGRRDRRAPGRAADARRRCSRRSSAAAADASSTACRRSTPRCWRAPTCRAARSSSAAPAASRPARRCRRRSAGAGRERFGVDILDGHRLDRDAAHLPLATAPARCATAPPACRCPATRCGSSTRTASDVADGEIGELWSAGRPAPRRLLEQARASRARPSAGDWTRTGDKYTRDARRLLHLLRPHRRHAQGRRHLGLAVRGRGGADHASRRCSKPPWSASEDERRLIKPKAFVVLQARRRRRRRRWPRSCRSTSRHGSRRTSIRAGSNSSTSCPRPRPARSSASSCAGRRRRERALGDRRGGPAQGRREEPRGPLRRAVTGPLPNPSSFCTRGWDRCGSGGILPDRLAAATGRGVFALLLRAGYGHSDPVELPRPLRLHDARGGRGSPGGSRRDRPAPGRAARP